jgi:hypothetical protein
MSKQKGMSEAQKFFAGIGRAAGLEQPAAFAAGYVVQRLLGFWVMWHLAGGLEPLLGEKGWLSRSWVYRQRSQFHQVMRVEVENFWPEAAAVLAKGREAA